MKRVVNLSSVLGAVAVATFVSVEILVVLAAAIWGFSGLLGLGRMSSMVFAVVLAVPAILGLVRTWFLAFDAETDPLNN